VEAMAMAAAAALFAAAIGAAFPARLDPEVAARKGSLAYAHFVEQIGERARAASVVLVRAPGAARDERLAAYRSLESVEELPGLSRQALFVFDPSGDLVAWAGSGVPHELAPPPASEGPRPLAVLSGFTRATFHASEPIRGGGWAVAAVSVRMDELPFEISGTRHHPWRLSRSPSGGGPRGISIGVATGAPSLELLDSQGSAGSWPGWLETAGLSLLAIACFWKATARVVALLLLSDTTLARGNLSLAAAGWLGLAAALAARVCGASLPGSMAAGVGTVAAVAALVAARPERLRAMPYALGALTGTAAILLASFGAAGFGAAGLGARWAGIDAASGGASGLAGLWGLSGLVLGGLSASGRRTANSAAREVLWRWAAAVATILACAAHDRPRTVAMALPVAAALAARALSTMRPLRSAGAALLACTLSIGIATAAATATARWSSLEGIRAALSALHPPGNEEIAALRRATQSFLAATDLIDFAPAPLDRVDSADLAVALWQRSPLARPNLLSALVVRGSDGALSVFSNGLPLDGGRLDESPARWSDFGAAGWKGLLQSGSVVLRAGADPWGEATFYLLPRPGFSLPVAAGAVSPEALVLSPRATQTVVEGLPAGVLYGLFEPNGRVIRPPWEEASTLSPSLLQGGRARIVGPAGLLEAFAARGADGIEVLYQPLRGPLEAIEECAGSLAKLLALGGVAVGSGLLLGLPRFAVRDTLRRSARSYARRLVGVYTLLLVVPLGLLSLAGVKWMEGHLVAEARRQGTAALSSAQRVLGEYLQTLEPGYSLSTTLDNALLDWLAGVVRDEVNLYWDARFYASSRPELFAAGVLPRRLPGDVQARLGWIGDPLASHVHGAGADLTVFEFYAPLQIPGLSRPASGSLVLSVPRAAQERRLEGELRTLRRRALLMALAICGLLAAVGGRLARSFTRPIQEIVAGTRRIAGGAASSGLSPQSTELAALVEAIDRMAGRIAEAREGLLREKRVVESVVDNITAAVVSVDPRGVALLANRAARDLLGLSPGDHLEGGLRERAELSSLAQWVSVPPAALAQTSLRIKAGGHDREWTAIWVPIPGGGSPAALLVVEDATEVLQGQRLAAWAEMARRIAHEIKNPLTPIRLSAEHLREVYQREPAKVGAVLDHCVANILRQVENLREIASDFSTYSQIPVARLEPGDLRGLLERLVDGYSMAPAGRPAVRLQAGTESVPASFDQRLLERAIRNLIENALRASPAGSEVWVELKRENSKARIEVADRGPGVPADMLEKIFEPYFSTHDHGTGLGLPIARRIVTEHGGTLGARNRPGGGLAACIELPALP